jgi:hypothetical protein
MKFLALGVMLALTIVVQLVRDRVFAFGATENQILYLQSPRVVQRVALSYDSVLADLYWIRALQHFGRERLKEGERRYDLLYPLLDLATTLDPLFTVGYRFGAIFLAEPRPGGAGRPDQALTLLKKGIAINPGKWDYYHDIGFIYYWNLHDYKQAAYWFGRGGNLPGAPWWLKTYSAVMLTRGGDRQASRAMWTQLSVTAENDWLQQTAHLRLRQLDALDQIDGVTRAVREFVRRRGTPPASWEELIGAGLLRGIPIDPDGTPYILDGATGEVKLAAWSSLHPLPTEPAAAPELSAIPQ